MNSATVHIPVQATYRIIDGEPVMVDATYADVPADAIARLLMKGLNVPIGDPAITQ